MYVKEILFLPSFKRYFMLIDISIILNCWYKLLIIKERVMIDQSNKVLDLD